MTSTASHSQPNVLSESEDSSTRQKIVATALEAFSELGFDGASTRSIAARAGVNQGLIPYYFGNKEALWREAVDWAFLSMREAVVDFAVEVDLDERQRAAKLIRRFVRFVSQHPEFVRLMNEEGKRDGARTRWLVERHVRPIHEKLTSLFQSEALGGRWPADLSPLHFHYIFVGAVSALFHQAPECRLLTGSDPSEAAVAERHADALIQLFLGTVLESDAG